jgi:CHAT domain-containing protein
MGVRNVRVLISVGFWAISGVLAPIASPAADPQQLLSEAERLFWLDNWPKARPLYDEAERLFSQAGDRRNALFAKVSKLRADADQTSYPGISQYLAHELDNPLVQADPKLRLRCLIIKATIDLSIDPTLSAQVWHEAQELAEQLGEKGWANRAAGELGIVAFLEGNTAQAQAMVGKALVTAMALGDLAGQIRQLSLIGVGLSEIGLPERALPYLDQALKLASKDKDVRFPLMAYMGKAGALDALGRFAESDAAFEKALQYVDEAEMAVYRADVLLAMGDRAVRAKDRPKAIKYLEEALAAASKAQMPRPRAAALLELSRLYEESGDLNTAEARVTEGLEASRKLVDMYVLPRHLATAARIKTKLGKVAEADSLYEEASDLIEGMLVNVPSLGLRSTLIGEMSEIYVGHFGLAVQQLKDVPKAFRIVERARGRVAADMLRTRPAEFGSAPTSPQPEQRRIVDIQIRLQQASSARERRLLLQQLVEAEESLAPIFLERDRLRKFVRSEPVDLNLLRRQLANDEAVIEFVLSEPASFALAVTKEGVRAHALRGAKAINDLATQFLEQIKAKKDANQGLNDALYSMLVLPVPEVRSKARLVIVPDGNLHALAFDSLRDSQSQYLGDRHILTYAPSATALYLLRTIAPERRATLPLLAVGGPGPDGADRIATETRRARVSDKPVTRGIFDLSGADMKPLPWVADEVQSVAAIGGKGSVILLGVGATEAAFKAQPLDRFRTLHLALHGIADTKLPDRSALVLGSDSKAGEDGLLQAREISRLRLNADLVTLSACDTGIGRLQGQEGMANLVRAFLFAGSRSVVAALWEVDDTFTASLMKRFYANLALGEDVGQALQHARREVRERFGGDAVPYYWAPFTVVGDGSRRVTFGVPSRKPNPQIRRSSGSH